MLASLALLPLLAVCASASSTFAPRMTTLFPRQLSQSTLPAACSSTCTSTITIYNACVSSDLNTCLTVCQQDTFNEFIGCFNCVIDNTPGVTPSLWTQLENAIDELKAECSSAGQTVTGGLDALSTASASGTAAGATGTTGGVATSASGAPASLSSVESSLTSALGTVIVAGPGLSSVSSIASAAVASASSSVASAQAATTSALTGGSSATAAASGPSSSVSMSSASPMMNNNLGFASATGVMVIAMMAVGLGAWNV